VLDVCACVNDVGVNTLASALGVEVFVEGSEAQAIAMGDTSKTPWSVLLQLWGFFLHGMYLGIKLDVINLEST
jgi:hypothetical protein